MFNSHIRQYLWWKWIYSDSTMSASECMEEINRTYPE